MAIPQRFRRVISSIEEKLISTSYIENEIAEWTQYLFDALAGEFDDNEGAIKDATEELESFNKRLAQRKGCNVYVIKFRYFNDPENKAKSVEGTLVTIGHSGEEAMVNLEQQHPGFVAKECDIFAAATK